MMIEITPSLALDEKELSYDFIRSSGPGGQNVNKVSTAVQLRFNASASSALSADIKARLVKLAGSRMTDDGILLIEAKRYRSQEKNRLDAMKRLVTLLQQAAEPPKARRATKPSLTAKAARVGAKRKRGDLKRTRSYNPDEWE